MFYKLDTILRTKQVYIDFLLKLDNAGIEIPETVEVHNKIDTLQYEIWEAFTEITGRKLYESHFDWVNMNADVHKMCELFPDTLFILDVFNDDGSENNRVYFNK